MPKIEKTNHFIKMEEKYLKRLNPKQKCQYFSNVEQFEKSKSQEFFDKMKTHPLSWDSQGFHSFTCLHDTDRKDRIKFEILDDDTPQRWPKILYEEIEETLFHLVWSHDQVY